MQVEIRGLAGNDDCLGSVPDNYDLLLHLLRAEGYIRKRPKIQHQFEGDVVESLREDDGGSWLDDAELATVRFVASQLGSLTSKSLYEGSHEERAWLETEEAQCILYSYARDLGLGGT